MSFDVLWYFRMLYDVLWCLGVLRSSWLASQPCAHRSPNSQPVEAALLTLMDWDWSLPRSHPECDISGDSSWQSLTQNTQNHHLRQKTKHDKSTTYELLAISDSYRKEPEQQILVFLQKPQQSKESCMRSSRCVTKPRGPADLRMFKMVQDTSRYHKPPVSSVSYTQELSKI